MARIGLAGAALAVGAVFAVPVGNGAESAARIIDRTLVCPMGGAGYPDPARFISVSADPFLPASGASPNVYAHNGSAGAPRVTAEIRTGRGGQARPSLTTGALMLTPPLCARTELRVSLASSGRNARPTGPFGESWRCEVPARVLIRVRAVFKRPTRLTRTPRDSWLFQAKGNIATGYVAVTTLAGRKPIFFASVNDATGKARIFVPPGCARSR